MPIPDSYKAIVQDLSAKTRAGKVRWRETPGGAFFVAFKEFSFEVAKEWEQLSQGYELAGVEARLRNSKGAIIDSFSCGTTDPSFRVMIEMEELARRNARRIDEALALIAQELQSEGVAGADEGVEEVPEDALPPADSKSSPKGDVPF